MKSYVAKPLCEADEKGLTASIVSLKAEIERLLSRETSLASEVQCRVSAAHQAVYTR